MSCRWATLGLLTVLWSCSATPQKVSPQASKAEEKPAFPAYYQRSLDDGYDGLVSELQAGFQLFNAVGCREEAVIEAKNDPVRKAVLNAQGRVYLSGLIATQGVRNDFIGAAVQSTHLSLDVEVVEGAVFGCFEGLADRCIEAAAHRSVVHYLRPKGRTTPESMIQKLTEVSHGLRDEHHALTLGFGRELKRDDCLSPPNPDWPSFLRLL